MHRCTAKAERLWVKSQRTLDAKREALRKAQAELEAAEDAERKARRDYRDHLELEGEHA